MANKLFVPVAEIDLKAIPNGQVSLQMRPEGDKMVIYMSVVPIPAQLQTPQTS